MGQREFVKENTMYPAKTKARIQSPTSRLAWLIGGDLFVLLLFTWIGRSSHAFPVTDVLAGLFTAAPFGLSWFLIAPWLGLFQAEVNQAWRKWVPRLGLAWLLAGPLAALLRALLLGRPIPEGIIPIFIVITTVVAGSFMLIWRLGYSWWITHTPPPGKDAQDLNS
jgi:hypothetical protein